VPHGGRIATRLRAALRVLGDSLDPEDVTALLGIAPSRAHRRGDLLRHGTREVPARTGSWVYSRGFEHTEEWNLDSAITALLADLPDDPAIWDRLTNEYRADVFCGLFMGAQNQQAELRPATLARLTERQLSLALDIYQ
jgi:hypothetical protein